LDFVLVVVVIGTTMLVSNLSNAENKLRLRILDSKTGRKILK
jgi:hypothetical protein